MGPAPIPSDLRTAIRCRPSGRPRANVLRACLTRTDYFRRRRPRPGRFGVLLIDLWEDKAYQSGGLGTAEEMEREWSLSQWLRRTAYLHEMFTH
jgi:hypothetical protein